MPVIVVTITFTVSTITFEVITITFAVVTITAMIVLVAVITTRSLKIATMMVDDGRCNSYNTYNNDYKSHNDRIAIIMAMIVIMTG